MLITHDISILLNHHLVNNELQILTPINHCSDWTFSLHPLSKLNNLVTFAQNFWNNVAKFEIYPTVMSKDSCIDAKSCVDGISIYRGPIVPCFCFYLAS